jgi:protein ImuA
MSIDSTSAAPEAIHPSLWRASQIACSSTRTVSTGWSALDLALPGRGWPTGALTELHVRAPGSGELRLIQPVLCADPKGRIVLINPPHNPNALALAAMGVMPKQVVLVQPERTADALWAAETVLKNFGASAVLLWQTHVRNESLRRLNLAAADTDGCVFLFRPLACARDASPAPLRLSVTPALGGVDLTFLKRRGPTRASSLFIPLSPSFVPRHAPVDRSVPAKSPARIPGTELVG